MSLYRSLDADRIIGEVNNGGDLIEAAIRRRLRTCHTSCPASKGGGSRRACGGAMSAARCASGHSPELEDQCCAITVDLTEAGWSPDRVGVCGDFDELFRAFGKRETTMTPQKPQFSMIHGLANWNLPMDASAIIGTTEDGRPIYRPQLGTQYRV